MVSTPILVLSTTTTTRCAAATRARSTPATGRFGVDSPRPGERPLPEMKAVRVRMPASVCSAALPTRAWMNRAGFRLS
jgi:hypothetical protein